MAWGRLDDTFCDHPKMKRLARELGVSPLLARGIMATLWSWAYRYAPDGDIGNYDPEDIAESIGWDGDAMTLIGAMKKVKLLDDDNVIHGFYELNESHKAVQRQRKKREKERVSRDSTVTVTPDREERTEKTEKTEREQNRFAIERPPTKNTEPHRSPSLNLSVDEREMIRRTEQLAARPPSHKERKTIRDLVPHKPTEAEWKQAYELASNGIGKYPQAHMVLLKLHDVVARRLKAATKRREVACLDEAREKRDQQSYALAVLGNWITLDAEITARVRQINPDPERLRVLVHERGVSRETFADLCEEAAA